MANLQKNPERGARRKGKKNRAGRNSSQVNEKGFGVEGIGEIKAENTTEELHQQHISHGLKTNSTNIVGFSKLLIDGEFGELNEPQKRSVQQIIYEAERQIRSIQELRAPIVKILEFSQALMNGELGGLNEEQTKNLRIIIEEAEKQIEFIQRVGLV